MKIYWKDNVAYDEKHNFLAIIHQLPNTYFCGYLYYRTDDIDYRQLDINEPTFEKTMDKIETIFKGISDISEIENLLIIPSNDRLLPGKFLQFLSEFAINCP